jgi:exonuclease SbcD
MRFLHTSDWHLGRIFHGAHLTSDQAHILEQFIYLARDSKINAIVIAGDIYDRAVPPPEAINLLDEVISKLTLELKIPVIMIAGNHDSPERLGFGSRLLSKQGFHLVSRLESDHTVILSDNNGPVEFHLIPYTEPPVVREYLEDTSLGDHNSALKALVERLPKSSARQVLVTHHFVAGGLESESERPLSVGGTGTVDSAILAPFNYVALGHLHRPQKVSYEHIQYSGSLLKYSFSEIDHAKSINLVELSPDGKPQIEKISLSPRREMRHIKGYLSDILKGQTLDAQGKPISIAKDDYLMVTLQDEGALLDAIGQLRSVYDNVLHIERPIIENALELAKSKTDHRKVSDLDLFTQFFSNVTSQDLSPEQKKAYIEVVGQLHAKEREVAT